MRTFRCTCGNDLFFENSHCLSCEKPVGWCGGCREIAPFESANRDGLWHCGQCGAALAACANRSLHQVCNRSVLVQPGREAGGTTAEGQLCDYCQLTDTIPDLDVEGNRDRWYELEMAKRRLLYTLERIGLPIVGTEPASSFDFKGDVVPGERGWRGLGKHERVYTGHAEGKITINVEEADDEVREKMRVSLGESHRTLVGHFHHEIGHFYWDVWVKGDWRDRFVTCFGDPAEPDYATALQSYYETGPPENWSAQFISAYATMHPWEDFAETFASYLDMVAVVDTAQELRVANELVDVATCELETMLAKYQTIGMVLNEMNRTLGLLDFLPDVFNPAVVAKLEYVHALVRAHASG